MLSRQHIVEYSSEAGFSLCGVARARVLSEYEARFAAGLATSGEAALSYLVRDPDRRLDPSRLLHGAQTVVVCALAYDGQAAVETPAGRISAHRGEGDYQPRIKAMLGGVLEGLQVSAPGRRGKICGDTSPILEKAWAVEAGLGWIGRNSLLIHPELGSFLLLGELIMDSVCDLYDSPLQGVGCGSCRRCVEACPVGALVADGVGVASVDTGRCVSARTIESGRKGGVVSSIHGWIWGCDECQTVCPRQKKPGSDKKTVDFF
jgi:epoxyqueuosine reductase